MSTDLKETSERCIKIALSSGAKEAAVAAHSTREVSVQWRDGRVEEVTEATTRGVTVHLYVDERYSVVTSSDLRPDALQEFIANAVTMTRTLAKDPFRSLPDPKLYEGRPTLDLELLDDSLGKITHAQRRAKAKEIEDSARSVKDSSAIVSVTTTVNDSRSIVHRFHSNGFSGSHEATHFSASAEVSVKDTDGRRPEGWSSVVAHRQASLPSLPDQGRDACERALARRGSKRTNSGVLSMAVENRVAGRLFHALLAPLSGGQLQQKRSFLDGKLGQSIGSGVLTWMDDPLIPGGLGSRLFDSEGISAKALPIIEKGELKNYFIDTYYGKKLKHPPTTGGPSNARFALGSESQAGLLRQMKDGILVTGFIGGNSNGTTGDFSLGIQGFLVRSGQIAQPVSEMNISGNLGDIFRHLVAVGNDPYPFSSFSTPTLLFEGIHFSGA